MNSIKFSSIILMVFILGCQESTETDMTKKYEAVAYETSRSGQKLSFKELKDSSGQNTIKITLKPIEKFQEIIGFGGAFTESSAYLLNQLGEENREEVIRAYFDTSGANYSLTRTHMNSCDFSLRQYSYAPIPGDTMLQHFSVHEDSADLIPMIQDAMKVSSDGFKILASPWTAPPWMKDNHDWVGGKLLQEYYPTWALFFEKYIQAYQEIGIPIWGLTVENEPHGNGNNWESMHYTPEEMTDFVQNHLGPQLEKAGLRDVKILGYDQNRAGLKEWVDVMFRDSATSEYYDGTAVHWYESTYDYFPEALDYAYQKAPDKLLLQTEACVDAEVPHWKDDDWYWQKEATDWGWDWASEEEKYLHPKYVPVYRYARDIIGCLNHWVQGWIDWNMVLDTEGGPNWFENWCVAPVIVDPAIDEVYYTPLYYTMAHFSKFIRPGAHRIGLEGEKGDLQMTAAENTDGSIALVLLNETQREMDLQLNIEGQAFYVKVAPASIQTIIFNHS